MEMGYSEWGLQREAEKSGKKGKEKKKTLILLFSYWLTQLAKGKFIKPAQHPL